MIRQTSAYEFWQKYIGAVREGHAESLIPNPAIGFTHAAKAGEFDALSDEEYETALTECEQFSSLWHDMPYRQAGQILLELLQRTDIGGSLLQRMLRMLAVCSSRTQYRPETDAKPQDDAASDVPAASAAGLPKSVEDCFPHAIYSRLCQRVRGQDNAKRAAAMVLYNHLCGRRSNSLFCGPTGCGKSEIWRCLSREYPGLIRLFDGSRLTAEGWKGSLHLRDIFLDLPDCFGEHGLIVVLDEADKLCCERMIGSAGTDHSALAQNSLLKLMDGDTIQFGAEDGKPAFSIDASHVSVVLLGAFENLMNGKSEEQGSGLGFGAAPRQKKDYSNTTITYNDLINAGMRREIAGRINRIASLRPLDVPDFRAILVGPVLSDIQAAGRYRVVLDDATVDWLSQLAATAGLGVRWMRSQVINAVDDLMFDDPTADTYTVSISPEAQAS